MRAPIRTRIVLTAALALCMTTASAEIDLRGALWPEDIVNVRISLNPWGGQIGFETEIAGDDPRIEALAEVIRNAEPGGGHKCPNAGAIRFRMVDGSVIGFGLLPSHTKGVYELRSYDGDHLVGVFRVERLTLLDALGKLGVPTDDPAFRE